jgi:uncharacterized protein involved in exopolysaccharide biosynthesis
MAQISQVDHPRPERTPAGPEGGLPLREVLAILRRRRRVVFWTMAIVTTVAVLMGLQVTRTYTATAQVMIERARAASSAPKRSRRACRPRTARSSRRTSS